VGTYLNADILECICNLVYLLLISKAEDAHANASISEHLK
jgi:hypothetical protein